MKKRKAQQKIEEIRAHGDHARSVFNDLKKVLQKRCEKASVFDDKEINTLMAYAIDPHAHHHGNNYNLRALYKLVKEKNSRNAIESLKELLEENNLTQVRELLTDEHLWNVQAIIKAHPQAAFEVLAKVNPLIDEQLNPLRRWMRYNMDEIIDKYECDGHDRTCEWIQSDYKTESGEHVELGAIRKTLSRMFSEGVKNPFE